MENKCKNNDESTAKSQGIDTWESIKKEFNNILQNQFDISADNHEDFQPQFTQNNDEIPTALMQNGLGFSAIQNAILKNIGGAESQPKVQNWNNLASTLLTEHSNLLKGHITQSSNDNTEIPHDKLTPFFINIDDSLPFNPANINNIEEFLNNILANSTGTASISWQHEIYSGFQLMNSFYQSYHKLQNILSLTIPQATINFEKRIDEEIPKDKEKFSISDIYYMWIASCENAYLQVTSTEEFSVTYGALINDYCELKLSTSNFTETVSNLSGLPTQKDLDSSYHEQYILRKQQNVIQEDIHTIQHQHVIDNQINTNKLANLTSEIEVLKQQISQFKDLLDNKADDELKNKVCDNLH